MNHFFSQRCRGFLRTLALAVTLAMSSRGLAQPSDTPLSHFWRPDDAVNTMLVTNGTLYLGGLFRYIGPDSGGGGVIDLTSAEFERGFPKIDGSVFAVVPDGAGGWFLGGAFTNIGGVIRTNLAHVRSDHSVDSSWTPHLNGLCRTLLLHEGQLYVGGAFTRIGGQTRNRLASVNPTNGTVSPWNPNAGNVVNTMVLDPGGTTLYVGGTFTTVGSTNRNRIAALDLASGLATSWDPDAAQVVTTIALDGNTVYAGGNFTTIGGQPRNRLAALDATTGLATGWNPNVQGGAVSNVVVFGGNIYVGGGFTTIGGVTRVGIAAVDPSTALPTSWNPNPNTNVTVIVPTADAIYVGGGFTNIGGAARPQIAALDPTNGTALAWYPVISDLGLGSIPEVFSLRIAANDIFVGGAFPSIGGSLRDRVGAIDISTGEATDWNPSASGPVAALAFADNKVYVGGAFTNIGGQVRNRLAALTNTTGAATEWDPNVRGRAGVAVLALALNATNAYVGGVNTTNVGGQLRTNLFAVSLETGQPTAWAPHAYRTATIGNVSDLKIDGDSFLVAGDFLTIGGQARSNLVAINIETGVVEPWNTFASGGVSNVVLIGTNVYAGGAFSSIGTVLRNRIGAVDRTNGLGLLSWNPDAGSQASTRVNTLAKGANVLYVGGVFNTMGGFFRTNGASIFIDTGTATTWHPAFGGGVRQMVLGEGLLFAGGIFQSVGGKSHGYLAVFGNTVEIARQTLNASPGSMQFGIRTGEGPETQVVVERSIGNLSNFIAISTNLVTGSTVPFTDSTPVDLIPRYYRAYIVP